MDENVHIDQAQKKLLMREALRKELIRGLNILLLVIIVFLFLRIVLRLFGANPENIFAGFIFFISGIFLLPFFGIFPNFRDTIVAGEMSVDASAFIALFCYIVLILLAMSVIHITIKIIKTQNQADETVERSRRIDTTVVDEAIE